MIVRVKGYLTFRRLVGERSVELEAGETLRTLLGRLAVEIGDPFTHQISADRVRPQERVAVLLNGSSTRGLPEGLETRLHDGDEVAVFSPLMGG